MRIHDIIYFSINLRLEDLDLNNRELVIKYFQERIEDYYFKPIQILVTQEMAFSAGALECLLIDAFARYATTENGVEKRMVDWSEAHLNLSKDIATDFYKIFRCGLLHESHIKQFGQFCFDEYYISEAIKNEQNYIVVNPKYLLIALQDYLNKFIKQLKNDDDIYAIFIARMNDDFAGEVLLAKNV